jgi:hypothetical protein
MQSGLIFSVIGDPRGGINMRDIDSRAGWKMALEAMLPLAGSLAAFFLIMAVR